MAYFVSDEFPEADIEKLMKMCLIHDLGEAFTGDIPTFEKTESDEEKEAQRLKEWVRQLPKPFAEEMQALYQEMEERQTLEARIYKALDNLEALIQHNESDISTWIPLEYDLQMTYGNDKVQFSEYLTKLRNEVRNDSRKKIAEKNLTEEAQGKIWICKVPDERKAREVEQKYRITSKQYVEGGLQLRVISEIQPELECMSIPATLEDAYIYVTNQYE